MNNIYFYYYSPKKKILVFLYVHLKNSSIGACCYLLVNLFYIDNQLELIVLQRHIIIFKLK